MTLTTYPPVTLASPAPLSLLVVDMSENWEETMKAHERGYYAQFDEFDHRTNRGYYADHELVTRVPLDLFYPHGSLRAGFDAISDTVRLAHRCGIPCYSVYMYDPWSDGGYDPASDGAWLLSRSLRPFVPTENEYEKRSYGAFQRRTEDGYAYSELPARLEKEGCTHLLIVGYDRDACVLETAKGAVERGITVVSSEHCMLTNNRSHLSSREPSLAYYRQRTRFLESLPDVWNYIRASTKTLEK